MTNQNSNTLILIFIGIIIIIVVIYLINKSKQPLQNEGTLPKQLTSVAQNANVANKQGKTVSDSIINSLIGDYKQKSDNVTGLDPLSSDHGEVDNYNQRAQHQANPDATFDSDCDPRDFVYKKQKFTKRTPEDIEDLFNVNKMLPQEIEDWFDTEPLLTTKKIKGTHMIHPKVHMGVNTISGSLRNGTHDIRGDIVNPKIPVSPWGNSTIEPDTNIKGVCN